MPTLTVTFEELPVLVLGGFEAGSLNGTAEVSYHADGEWFVKKIYLEGSRKRLTAAGAFAGFNQQSIEVEFDAKSPSWLYLAIWGQLTEGRFKRQIDKVVGAELEAADIPIVPFNAEHRLTARELRA